jgi:hypothetical protein
MTLPVVFRRAAQAEFDEAADWYEQRRAGFGAAFAAAVQRALARIAVQPDFYRQIYQDAREGLVSGFPYCVHYCASRILGGVPVSGRLPGPWFACLFSHFMLA